MQHIFHIEREQKMIRKFKQKEVKIDEKFLLPQRHYSNEHEAFVMADGSFLDILAVRTKDRKNLKDEELKYYIYRYTKFYKQYEGDIKYISMNFPVDTSLQRKFMSNYSKKTLDKTRQKWLTRKIDKFNNLDDVVNRREYYLMYFAKSVGELVKNRSILKNFSAGRNNLFLEIGEAEKFQVIKKLLNMNTLIVKEELKKSEILEEEDE